MSTVISQRDVRNNSGDIMRAPDQGQEFIITRDGVPVGELGPVRRQFVRRDALAAAIVGPLAERAAGPHATSDEGERARRQDRLQRIEALMDPLPFDADAARTYGRVYAATRAAGRKPRGPRSVDMLILAVALSRSRPLFTSSRQARLGVHGDMGVRGGRRGVETAEMPH